MYCFVDALRDLVVRRLQARLLLLLLLTTYNVQSVSALITFSDGAICFFALHRAAMLCSRYVFLDVVPSTSGNSKISRTNATIRIVISFFFEGLIKSQASLYSSLNV